MSIDSINGVKVDNSFTSKSVQSVDKADQKDMDTVLKTGAVQSGMVNKDILTPDTKKTVDNSEQGEKSTSLHDVKDLSKIINGGTVAEFGYNEPTKRITIKIKDKQTNEVIKEIPSEKALEMLAKVWELAGIMVDEKR